MKKQCRDRATEYAEEVKQGKHTVGKLHMQACLRHINDIKRQNTDEFPYIWDPEASERIIDFCENMTIAEGNMPKAVKLYGFQCFDIGVPFGWKKRDGLRRFRRKYKSVARQNGKTFENGLVAAYIMGFSGYNLGKLFTAATKKRQARLAWEETKRFIEIDPDLGELFKIQDYKSLITCNHTGCTMEALSKEAGLDDGFRSIFSSVDELHQHKDGSVLNALYRGTRMLPETLVCGITTRGNIINGFCKELDDYATNILLGNAIAEDFFVDIYCLDEGDNIFEEKNWIKANPLLMRIPEKIEQMRVEARTAKDMGGMELMDFKTKCLNLWARDINTAFIDIDDWVKCGREMKLEMVKGNKCYLGLDLSSGGDLTSMSIFIPQGEKLYYVWSHSFMPAGRFYEHIETDLAPYDWWRGQGLLTVTGGQGDYKNDFKFIISKAREIIEEYDLKLNGIAIDPYNADGILSDLESFGVPVMIVRQSARELNSATEALKLDIKSGYVMYDKADELLSWSISNAKIVRNSFGEMKIDKEPNAQHRRIDPIDALINAYTMYLRRKDNEPIDHTESFNAYMAAMGWK